MKSWNGFLNTSVLTVGLGMSLVGCSSQTNFLQGIGLNITQQDQTSYVNLSAKVDLGSAVFDAIQIPVNDPRTGVNVGSVKLSTGADGKTTVMLSMDANVALNADPRLGATLPNGRPIPSAVGAANGELLAFPILEHSRVYIGGDLQNHIIAGVAIAVKGLDNIMGQIGASSNIFFVKKVGEVNGVAGIYGSSVADQSGIAVFAKYDIPAPTTTLQLTSLSKSSRSVVASATPAPVASSPETFVSQGMNDNGKQKLYNYLFSGKKRVLRAH